MLLLLLGVLVGTSLVGVHERWPLLVLGVAACATTVAGLPRAWWARPPFAVGTGLVVALASVPRSEGDYLVGADAQGYVVLLLTVALVVGSLVTSVRPRPGARS